MNPIFRLNLATLLQWRILPQGASLSIQRSNNVRFVQMKRAIGRQSTFESDILLKSNVRIFDFDFPSGKQIIL